VSVILRQQRTIARAVKVQGFGYWSGQDVNVEFRPASPDSGLVFVRKDLTPSVRIAAHVAHRVDVPRRTNLAAGGAKVEMVEHVLAACAGLEIDNCEIHVDQPELPGCDGSSQPFVTALMEAGIENQDAPRRHVVIEEVVRVGDEDAWVEARPPDHHGVSLLYHLEYDKTPAIGTQQIDLDLNPEAFQSELASARTFLLEEEAESLRSQGLGERVSYADVLVFSEQGPLHNALRFPDECVRHKTLDLVGDLALAGCDFIGRFVAFRSGHRLHAELVRSLVARYEAVSPRRKSA
jgi:UDP-3-O-acyl N-acetylglucosamine deacetylase